MVRDDISGLDIFQAFVAVKNRVVSFKASRSYNVVGDFLNFI